MAALSCSLFGVVGGQPEVPHTPCGWMEGMLRAAECTGVIHLPILPVQARPSPLQKSPSWAGPIAASLDRPCLQVHRLSAFHGALFSFYKHSAFFFFHGSLLGPHVQQLSQYPTPYLPLPSLSLSSSVFSECLRALHQLLASSTSSRHEAGFRGSGGTARRIWCFLRASLRRSWFAHGGCVMGLVFRKIPFWVVWN